MKKYVLALAISLSALSLTAVTITAEAKKMGGGSSMGRQSQQVTRPGTPPAAQQANQARPATPAAAAPGAAAPKPGIPWKGIAAGVIGGALLAGLFSSLGLGGAFASFLGTALTWLAIAAIGFFIFNWIRNRKAGNTAANPFQPNYAGAGANNVNPDAYAREAQSNVSTGSGFNSAPVTPAQPFGVPADFDTQGFLRSSKTYFIRLQAAWDKGDINDLREFTTPEMYAECKLQLQERGATPNVTDVVSLNADLLGIETGTHDYLASVRFTGMIKESEHAQAEPFSEVWNLSKPLNGQGGWVLAGIQQD